MKGISKELVEGFFRYADGFFDLKYFSLVSRERARELDAISERDYNIPTILLMENAGKAVAEHTINILRKLGYRSEVLIIAGGGNNGGDGFCAGKHIKNAGFSVKVAVLTDEDKIKGDSLQNFKIIKNMGVPIYKVSTPSDLSSLIPTKGVVVDAIFGTGLSRDIQDKFFVEVIEIINRWREEGRKFLSVGEFVCERKVVSVDIPSGLDSNTGEPRPIAVKADVTVTFAPAKVGLFVGNSSIFTGEVKVEDIGIPLELWKSSGIYLLGKEFIRYLFRRKERNRLDYKVGHKGDFGHLLCVCGGLGRAGAAILTGKGALSVGVGLVTIITPEVVYYPVTSGAREYMVIPAPSSQKTFDRRACEVFDEHLEGKTAVVIGPGIWVDEGSKTLLLHVIKRVKEKGIPCVFDADALNIISQIGPEILQGVSGVITPHPGEAGRILSSSSKDVQKNRISSALSLSRVSGCVAVLKGFRTVIAYDGVVFLNTTGSVELATGGTGDVLSGIIGGLIAQRYDILSASLIGVFTHGITGEIVSKENKFSLSLAEKVAEKVPQALGIILSNEE